MTMSDSLFSMRTLKIIQFLAVILALIPFVTEEVSAEKYRETYWTEVSGWNPCSATCGSGVQQKRMVCVGRDIYSSVRPINPERCASIEKPSQRTTRKCNRGECRYRYIWKVATMGACSQTCGNDGFRFREVECHYIVGGNRTVITDEENCERRNRPISRERCNHFDCPAEFSSTKWAACPKHRSDPCQPGVQRRKPQCTKTIKNGQTSVVPLRVCYNQVNKGKRTSFWRYCYEHVNTKECLEKNQKPAEITESDITVIQMRRAKRLKLQIGQTAYVIPWTRLIVRCPVNHFVNRQIKWQKGNNAPIEYAGRIKSQRVRVDDKGRLKINKFSVEDQGEWFCKAGDVKSRIILKVRSPSAGFHDWAQRNTLWNEEMLNEDPKTTLVKREIVQWVSTPWTRCSKSCGGAGIQTRTVHCERIDTRFYHILDDKVCTSKLLPKPDSKRVCNSGRECPVWKMENIKKDVCTNRCTGINKGTIQGNLTCVQQGQILPTEKCNLSYKPNMDCENSLCQVKWNISNWSKCSQSCGLKGVSARFLTCVWLVTGKPAGNLCYENDLPIPEVIRPCSPPPCRLKCVDLSPHCNKKKDFCRFTIYRFQCCKSCSESLLLT